VKRLERSPARALFDFVFHAVLRSRAMPAPVAALVVVVGAGIILSGCASRGSVRELDGRVQQIATDLRALREAHDAGVRETSSLGLELRTLSGRLRETDARLREAGDRIATLGNRLAAAETSLRELVTAVEAIPRTAPPAPAALVPERTPSRESSVPAEQVFAGALKTFQTGEHGQAVLELTDFIARYPKHPLAARAQLWIGQAYFRQRDYRQALIEYRKAVDAASDPTAAADAWLRIGQAYAALRERPAAAAAWQRVVREYPESEAAGRARALLRK